MSVHALALFRGPLHEIVAVNDELKRLSGRDLVGWPARLVYPEAEFRPSQVAMDAVYSDGTPRRLFVTSTEGVPGMLFIEPVIRDGSMWGVATAWAPLEGSQPRTRAARRAPPRRVRDRASSR